MYHKKWTCLLTVLLLIGKWGVAHAAEWAKRQELRGDAAKARKSLLVVELLKSLETMDSLTQLEILREIIQHAPTLEETGAAAKKALEFLESKRDKKFFPQEWRVLESILASSLDSSLKDRAFEQIEQGASANPGCFSCEGALELAQKLKRHESAG